jgi:hypothetical protein
VSTARNVRSDAVVCDDIWGLDGGLPYRSGRTRDWLKFKNPDAPAVKREAEEDWGNLRRR